MIWMRHIRGALVAIATLGALTGTAIAADAGAGGTYTKDTYPDALPSRPLTLPKGMAELDVPVLINLSDGQVGKPVSIPLALSYGLTNDLSLRVYHNTGLCLTGTDNGCAKVYNDIGADALWSFYRSGNYQMALHLGFEAARLSDPSVLRALAGLYGKGTFGRFGLLWAADVGFGLNNRDFGNKETLAVLLQPQLALSDGFSLYGLIGLDAPFDGFSDFYTVPVGAGLVVTPVHNIDVGVDFAFANLLGKNSNSDNRAGRIYARFRF